MPRRNFDTNHNCNFQVNNTEIESPCLPKTCVNTPEQLKITNGQFFSTDDRENKPYIDVSVSHFDEGYSALESAKLNQTQDNIIKGSSKEISSHYESSKISGVWTQEKKKYDFFESETKDEKANEVFATIENHLTKRNNVFRKLIAQFEIYFVSIYGKSLKSSRSNINGIKEEESSKATSDLQHFISMIYEAIIAYYSLEKIKQNQKYVKDSQFLNRDNIMSFVTYVIMSEKIYDVVFSLYCTDDLTTETLFKNNKEKYQTKGPEFFGVEDEYCLNLKTIDFFEKKSQMTPGSSESVLDSQNKRRFLEIKPFCNAILKLNKIKTTKNPNGKLKILLKVAKKIGQCIEKSYQLIEEIHVKKLDSEQTLALFVYILVQSELENLDAHCKIIENFTTGNILNSISGYYATTLRACFDHVCGLESQSVTEN